MNNWFTVHSPHGNRELPWDIYLQDRYKDIASSVQIGDRVFFYETKTNKNVKYNKVIGRMGLVHVGHVTGDAYPRSSRSEYTDGETKIWGTGIPTDAADSNGFVSREKVVEILGYKINYYFKGFASGTGIKKIEMEQAQQLYALFESSTSLRGPEVLAEEVLGPEKYTEGATKKISVNVYERNPQARKKCIQHYGYSCVVCGFNFSNVYGELGEDFIHVHHLKQLSDISKEYNLDPIKDLRPVCPNCHSMLHRKKVPLSIQELKKIRKNRPVLDDSSERSIG